MFFKLYAPVLIKIDISDKKVQKSVSDLDLGFSIKHDLKQLALQKCVTDGAVFMFEEEVISFLTKLCSHMMEKSPMTSPFARCLCCLSPAYILEQSEICEKFFEKIVEKLVSFKTILAKYVDAAKLEYSYLLTKIVKANKNDFVKFNKSSNRVDLFFGKYVNTIEYEQMWCVFKLLLCLLHGQASVEKGFSVNSKLVENMHEDSLIAQRIVHDHVKSLKLEAYEVKVTKTCLDNANRARRRYFDALKQKSVSNQCSERQTKIDSNNAEINLVNQEISLLKLLSTTQEKMQIHWQKKL